MKHLETNEIRDAQTEPAEPSKVETPSVEFSFSSGLASLLSRLNLSIAFSSYQSNLLYMLGILPGGGLHLHQSAMAKPMGLARKDSGGLLLSAGFQIIELANVLQPHERINQRFDACYMPRKIHVTGDLDAHDIDSDREGRIVFVNTRFNCLATVSPRHSFEPVWKPPFISSLVSEDRCHLNGLAMADGRPAYVTAVSRSDTIDGWRDRRSDGGVVIDVQTNRMICQGLSMPHSPRLHRGELWLLNAGTGELGVVVYPEREETGMGHFAPRVFCPGFLRGLAFHDNLAFVGLSQPRYKRFEGLALDQRLKDADSEPWCGIQVIDLDKRACVEWLRIDGAVGELFDVEILPGFRCPMAVSPNAPDAASLITFDPETTERGAAQKPVPYPDSQPTS